MRTEPIPRIALVAALLSALQVSAAYHIEYTDWTSAIVGYPGSASGKIDLPGGTLVDVSYSGWVSGPTQVGPGGTYYWTEDTPRAYTGNPIVGNTPPMPDIIALEAGTSTVTFSPPVWEPIMLVISLGQPNGGGPEDLITYSFSSPFDLLSEGPGYFNAHPNSLTQLGNVLSGYEGNGALQFQGWVDSITWTAANYEYWHGFTVGVPIVPESSTCLASVVLLLPLGVSTIRRLRQRRAC